MMNTLKARTRIQDISPEMILGGQIPTRASGWLLIMRRIRRTALAISFALRRLHPYRGFYCRPCLNMIGRLVTHPPLDIFITAVRPSRSMIRH